jgi:hypothetical protein
MFSFGCGIGEPYPLYDISLHVPFFSHARFARVHREFREKQPFLPIGISPIGEKFHSLLSPRSLCETSFHLVAAHSSTNSVGEKFLE